MSENTETILRHTHNLLLAMQFTMIHQAVALCCINRVKFAMAICLVYICQYST